MWRHGNSSHEFLKPLHGGGVEDVFQPGNGAPRRGACNFKFFRARRIIDVNQEHKPIQLRFGQRVGAFLFDRILRRQHKKRRFERVRSADDRDTMLLHGLQHRGLSLCWSSVNFVGQDNVGEDRPFDELEFAPTILCFLKDVCAGDVHRHQVRCELNAAEAK